MTDFSQSEITVNYLIMGATNNNKYSKVTLLRKNKHRRINKGFWGHKRR